MKLKINKTSTKRPDQKYKIKIIRTEVEILTTKRIKLYFLGDEKGKKEKKRKKNLLASHK
jgi:hypothetical protein